MKKILIAVTGLVLVVGWINALVNIYNLEKYKKQYQGKIVIVIDPATLMVESVTNYSTFKVSNFTVETAFVFPRDTCQYKIAFRSTPTTATPLDVWKNIDGQVMTPK